MTLDGFVTFLTLIVALLALASPVRRLQLRVTLGRILPLSLIAAAGVIYFEFFELLGLPCPSWSGTACPVLSEQGPVRPQQAAFLVVLVWLIAALAASLRPTLAPRSMPLLRSVAAGLARQGRVAELIDLIADGLEGLDSCAGRQGWLQRLHDRLAGSPTHVRSLDYSATNSSDIGLGARLKRNAAKALSRLVPAQQRSEEAATDILRLVLGHRDIVRFIAEFRPDFGAQALQLTHRTVGDFSDRLFEELIKRPDGALYREIEDNQNLDRLGYWIPERNMLLHATLSDARVAERLAVYQPIGEYALGVLGPSGETSYHASLNLPHDDHWQQRGRWRDPVFVTIRFFDIMVQAAASQGIRWHMWLFYMPHLIERLEALYDDTGSGADRFREWPTRAAYLMYAIFSALADWVAIAQSVPDDSPHRKPENARVVHENDNIPKSAALAPGQCMRRVVASDRIGGRFKTYLLEIACRIASDRLKGDEFNDLRTVVWLSLAEGGPVGPNLIHLERLEMLCADIERPWNEDLAPLQTTIAETRKALRKQR